MLHSFAAVSDLSVSMLWLVEPSRNAPGWCMPWDSLTEPVCLLAAGRREAEIHKWNRSRECGYDLGQSAIEEWQTLYWRKFLRLRRIEHVCGEVRYRQYGHQHYGQLRRDAWHGNDFLTRVVEHYVQGMENLEFVMWIDDLLAAGHLIPHERAYDLFAQLDPNCTRFHFPQPQAVCV